MSNYYHIRHINTQSFIAWYQQKLIIASWPSLCICSWEGITRYKSLVSVILNMYNQRDESFVVICVAVVRSFISSLNAWWRHQMEAFSALLAICAGIHRSPVNTPHKGQWRGALMFPLIRVWINGWVNNREVGDLKRQLPHYDVIIMVCLIDIY